MAVILNRLVPVAKMRLMMAGVLRKGGLEFYPICNRFRPDSFRFGSWNDKCAFLKLGVNAKMATDMPVVCDCLYSNTFATFCLN